MIEEIYLRVIQPGLLICMIGLLLGTCFELLVGGVKVVEYITPEECKHIHEAKEKCDEGIRANTVVVLRYFGKRRRTQGTAGPT